MPAPRRPARPSPSAIATRSSCRRAAPVSRPTRKNVRDVEALARQEGGVLDFYTVGVITCRPTMAEAEAYYRHSIVECADWNAVDSILAMKDITPANHAPDDFTRLRNEQANGMGGLPIVGDPDFVARELAILSE